MCSDWGTEPSDCRCAGAEIGSNGPCSLEGEVVVSVPVHGRCGSLERTGTAGDDVPSIQILHPSCPSLTAHSSSSPSTPPPPSSEALRGGRLHLQRAAAGRRIHALPVLAPRLPFVSGAQTVPGPPRRPLHSLPAAQEYLGRGERV